MVPGVNCRSGKPPARAAGFKHATKVARTIAATLPIIELVHALWTRDDPRRPAFLPEGYVNDPRMVLPRYWDTDADAHIDTVRLIGKEAAAYAEQNKAIELEYYDIVCSPAFGAIPVLP